MIDVGQPFSQPFQSLVESLQTSLLLGVEQPATLELLYRSGTPAYPIRGVGPVSGLAAQITGFVSGKPAVFNLGQHYTYAVGQLVWQPLDTSDPALAPGWFPDDNSRLTVGYFYRDLPSGITDFNAGSVAGTLVRAVSRELKRRAWRWTMWSHCSASRATRRCRRRARSRSRSRRRRAPMS